MKFSKTVNVFFKFYESQQKAWFKNDPPSKNIFPRRTSSWISSLFLFHFSFTIFLERNYFLNTQLNAMMSFNHFHFFI